MTATRTRLSTSARSTVVRRRPRIRRARPKNLPERQLGQEKPAGRGNGGVTDVMSPGPPSRASPVPCSKGGNLMTRLLRTAFTLIELLVVIAIIAILAAILFPVF